MKLEFKGVFPAPPTPVTEDGRINEKALRALLDDNIAHGCGGFWLAGSTGEGPILNEEQRDAAAKISAEVCKGRALVIMQVGSMSTASAVKAARTSRTAGCAAVCCLPHLFSGCPRPQFPSCVPDDRPAAWDVQLVWVWVQPRLPVPVQAARA